jgi:predicted pyridoxine 5'-phosphate oxidase superfamily flavin-nucleotide-binding protein
MGAKQLGCDPTASIKILTQVSTTTFQLNPSHFRWGAQHLVLGTSDKELLEVCSTFEQGSLGIVEEPHLKDQQPPSFVRKRVKLEIRDRPKYLEIVKDKTENLRALNHPIF